MPASLVDSIINGIPLLVGGIIVGIVVSEYNLWRGRRIAKKMGEMIIEKLLEAINNNNEIKRKLHDIVAEALDEAITHVIRRVKEEFRTSYLPVDEKPPEI